MSTAWWMKASRRHKVPRRVTIRWEELGLQDPTVISSNRSIEDIRREVLAASDSGLSHETLARSQSKGAFRRSSSGDMIEETGRDLLKKYREKRA
jgi:hypothetical protein